MVKCGVRAPARRAARSATPMSIDRLRMSRVPAFRTNQKIAVGAVFVSAMFGNNLGAALTRPL
jgi:hypothetical protein